MEQQQVDLNSPYKLGDLELKNRFVMAPLTRMRTDLLTGIPNDLMAEYYEQRANFGLIISEASPISSLSAAFPGAGGIYNEEQTQGWKKIVDRVHAKGSKIILQLWHSGRQVASELLGGREAISSYSLPISQKTQYFETPHPVPKQLSEEEIRNVVQEFKQGAIFAKQAGFDGVQIHGANGYLVDQFLRDGVNKRSDRYGGSYENRCRFLFEIIEAISTVYPSNRISVRFSPTGRFGDMYDSNPLELMKYALKELSKKNLHFVEIKRHGFNDSSKREILLPKEGFGEKIKKAVKASTQIFSIKKTTVQFYSGIAYQSVKLGVTRSKDSVKNGFSKIIKFENPLKAEQKEEQPKKTKPSEQIPDFYATLRPFYNGILMGNDGFTPESATEAINKGELNLVSFGVLSISNPDLPQRFAQKKEYIKPIYATFYQGGSEGYTDYPTI